MFREALLNRAIFVGVIFFLLVLGAQLYRWHIRCEIAAALMRTTETMQHLENRKEKHTGQNPDILPEKEKTHDHLNANERRHSNSRA